MKVLLVNSLYSPHAFGGAERSVQVLAESLARNGIEVGVYTMIEPGQQPDKSSLNGVAVLRQPMRNIYWPFGNSAIHGSIKKAIWHGIDFYNPLSTSAFEQALETFKPDIIHCNTLAGLSVSVLGIAKEKRLPVVQTLRDYYFLHPDCRTTASAKNFSSRYIQGLWQNRGRRALAIADAIVGISSRVLEIYNERKLLPATQQQVIYNSVAATINPQGPIPKAGSVFTLGFLGRLEAAKGIDWLLRSLGTYPDLAAFELLVAGTGAPPYLAALEAEQYPFSVRFIGEVTPSAYFPEIDLLVVPSQWEEPFGRVVIEAAVAGVPSLVSDKGGLPELITTLGRGYIFPAENTPCFHSILGKALNELDEHRQDDFNLAPFSESTIAHQYEELYREVLFARQSAGNIE